MGGPKRHSQTTAKRPSGVFENCYDLNEAGPTWPPVAADHGEVDFSVDPDSDEAEARAVAPRDGESDGDVRGHGRFTQRSGCVENGVCVKP